MKKKLLEELKNLRKNDYYGDPRLKEILQEKLFPASTEELVLDMSGVTAVFYGLLMKNTGIEIGFERIDAISKKTFYDIGLAKSDQCKAKIELQNNDTRAFFIVLASAIFNASPEYSFRIIKYSAEQTIVELHGIDRYFRILNQLGISDHVTFPTLIAFMNGIKDSFEIDCETKIDSEINKVTNEVNYLFDFKLLQKQT